MNQPTIQFCLKIEKENSSFPYQQEDFLPHYSALYSGYIVRSASKKQIEIFPNQNYSIPLGFQSFLPPNYFFEAYTIYDLSDKISVRYFFGSEDIFLVTSKNFNSISKFKINYGSILGYLRLQQVQKFTAHLKK